MSRHHTTSTRTTSRRTTSDRTTSQRATSLLAVTVVALASLTLALPASAQNKGQGKYEEHYEILPPDEAEPVGDAVPNDGALDPEGSAPEPAPKSKRRAEPSPDRSEDAIEETRGRAARRSDPDSGGAEPDKRAQTKRSDAPSGDAARDAEGESEPRRAGRDSSRERDNEINRARYARRRPAAADAAPEDGEDVADVSYFYDALDDGGEWLSHPRFGEVWQPNVEKDWRPYTIGRWAYSDDYGWTWISSEPFGWAVFHYGRWAYDAREGWLWVPGTEWAPAWVAWRHGEDAIGWAPLPPSARFANGRVNVAESALESDGVDRGWVFVRPRYFSSRDMRKFVRAPSWNTDLVHRTAPRLGYERTERGLAVRGLAPEDVEKLSNLPVQRVKIKPTDDPSLARRAGKSEDGGRGDQIRIYKPDKKRTADAVKRAERKMKSSARQDERRSKRDGDDESAPAARAVSGTSESESGRDATREAPAARPENAAKEAWRVAPSNAPKNTLPRASTQAKSDGGSTSGTGSGSDNASETRKDTAAKPEDAPAKAAPEAKAAAEKAADTRAEQAAERPSENMAGKSASEASKRIETGATDGATGAAPRQPPPDGSKRRWDSNGPSGAGSAGANPKADGEQE